MATNHNSSHLRQKKLLGTKKSVEEYSEDALTNHGGEFPNKPQLSKNAKFNCVEGYDGIKKLC